MAKCTWAMKISGVIILLVPAAICASTITVEQDGSGEYTSLAEAVDAAGEGDSILVGPGTYAESYSTILQLFIHSTSGPEVTVLDGQGTRRIANYDDGGGGTLSGFRLVNGFADAGGAILVRRSDLTIRNCHFAENTAVGQGGAISSGHENRLVIEDSMFEFNHAGTHGGAILVIDDSDAVISRCRFFENSAQVSAGGVTLNDVRLSVTDCLFVRNRSDDISGALNTVEASGTIANNTFYENTSMNHATVLIQHSTISVERNIFAFETQGYGLKYLSSEVAHTCNAYWLNADGPVFPAGLGEGEFIADPQFCGSELDVFEIYDISPCAPANNDCAVLIGALPVACTTTGVEESTFSRIKRLY